MLTSLVAVSLRVTVRLKQAVQGFRENRFKKLLDEYDRQERFKEGLE